MYKATVLVALVAVATNVLAARIARSPGGAGWHRSSGGGFGGYSNEGPSIIAARSSGGDGGWNSGQSFGRSSSGWGGSGLNARSGLSGSWGGSGSGGYGGYSSGNSRGYGGYSSGNPGGYGAYSGNTGGYGGYSAGAGGWDSTDYSDASGRSVSWQASW